MIKLAIGLANSLMLTVGGIAITIDKDGKVTCITDSGVCVVGSVSPMRDGKDLSGVAALAGIHNAKVSVLTDGKVMDSVALSLVMANSAISS